MSLKYGFLDAGYSKENGGKNFDRLYQADHISNTFNGIITQGVFPYIYVDGIKENFKFNVSTNGLQVTIGKGKAYYANLWAYNTEGYTLTMVSDNAYTKYAGIYLVFNKQIIYTSDTNISVNDVVKFDVVYGSAAANPTAPVISSVLDIYYMPIAYVKIPAKATSVTAVSAIGSSTVKIDSVMFTNTPELSSNIGSVDLSAIADEGSWGIANGAYDQAKSKINTEYDEWLKKDIKESNFSGSAGGTVADYYSRVRTVKNNKNNNYVIIYLKSLKKNLSGLTATIHNNTYPQYADVSATFSISETTPETMFILEHIGTYTVHVTYKKRDYTVEIEVPYFGEFYQTIEVKFGEGDVFGYRVNINNIYDVQYVKNYVYNTDIECANYELPATKIDWNTGYIDSNYDTYWKGAFFLPHPVILDSNGKEVYELDEDDLTKMIDKSTGEKLDIFTTAEMQSKGYNVMQAFPKVYTARFIYNGYAYFYISTTKIDDRFKCYAHINYKGEEIDYFYRSVYMGSYYKNSSNVEQLRSISGTDTRLFSPISSLDDDTSADNVKYAGWQIYMLGRGTLGTAQRLARNNNASKPIWNIEGISDLNLIKDYVVLLTKSFITYDNMGLTTYNGKGLRNGIMDKMGQFYCNGKMTFSNYSEKQLTAYKISNGKSIKYTYTKYSGKVNTANQRYCKFLGIERLQSELIRYCLGIWAIAPERYILTGRSAYDPAGFSSFYTTGIMTKNTYGNQDKTHVTDWATTFSWHDPPVSNIIDVLSGDPSKYFAYDYAIFDCKTGSSITSKMYSGWQYKYNVAKVGNRGSSKEGADMSVYDNYSTDKFSNLKFGLKHELDYNYEPLDSWRSDVQDKIAIAIYSNEYGYIFNGTSDYRYIMNYSLGIYMYHETGSRGVYRYPKQLNMLMAGPGINVWTDPVIDNGNARTYLDTFSFGPEYRCSYNLFNCIQQRTYNHFYNRVNAFGNVNDKSGVPAVEYSSRYFIGGHSSLPGMNIITDYVDGSHYNYYSLYSAIAALTCRPELSVFS